MYTTSVNLIYSWTILVTLCAACAAQESWLLLGADGNWRACNNENDWQKAAKDIQPLETAVINRQGKNISVVFDVQGESGDWRNVDRYVFQGNGVLARLERTFASASQDIRRTQAFELDASGRLKKKLDREVSLSTGKAKTEVPDKPPMPIATNVNQLDFMKAR